jgi:hypothetical protein
MVPARDEHGHARGLPARRSSKYWSWLLAAMAVVFAVEHVPQACLAKARNGGSGSTRYLNRSKLQPSCDWIVLANTAQLLFEGLVLSSRCSAVRESQVRVGGGGAHSCGHVCRDGMPSRCRCV